MRKQLNGTLAIMVRFDPMENHIENARVRTNIGVYVGTPEAVEQMIAESVAKMPERERRWHKGWDQQEYPQIWKIDVPVFVDDGGA